jgi:flagellin-like protein
MNVRKRKAISPLIATLLLIAIAVAASVLTYSWVMSMVGSQSAQAQTQLRIDTVQWDPEDLTDCTLLLRNTGSTLATIESVSIRENKAGSAIYIVKPTAPLSIDVGDTLDYPFKPVMTWFHSRSYVIRVTATTGFFYELVATTPALPPP